MTTLPEGPYFEFLLTADNVVSTLPTRMSAYEIQKLKDIPHLINAVRKTFGDRASEVFNLGDRIRVYVISESGLEKSLIPDDLHIPALIVRTAEEIVENASLQRPAPLAKALTSQLLVGILRAASSRTPEEASSITYIDDAGVHVIPALSATAFVQPAAPPVRSRTGTMPITGVTYSARGKLRILLTNDRIEASLTADLEALVSALPIAAIRDGVWFSGTICQDSNNRWVAAQGGRISNQEPIAAQPVAG